MMMLVCTIVQIELDQKTEFRQIGKISLKKIYSSRSK